MVFSKAQYNFLLTKFFFYSQEAFSKFLINIYLFRITSDVKTLVIYNAVSILSTLAAAIPAGAIIKNRDRFWPLRFGIVLRIVFLGTVIILGDSVANYLVAIAILNGFSEGFYWSSDNVLKFDLTAPGSRLRFTAAFDTLKQIAKSVFPFAASLIVGIQTDLFNSYATIFILAILFSLAAVYASFGISAQKTWDVPGFRLIKAMHLFQSPNVKLTVWGTFLDSIGAALPILISLLLFVRTGTEVSIGFYQAITVLIMVAANYYMGRYLTSSNYKSMLIYGGIANFVILFILLIRQDVLAVILYGVLDSLVKFTAAPTFILSQDVFNDICQESEECMDLRVEYLTIQGFADSMGAIVGFLILIFLAQSPDSKNLPLVIILFGVADFLAKFLYSRVKVGDLGHVKSLD